MKSEYLGLVAFLIIALFAAYRWLGSQYRQNRRDIKAGITDAKIEQDEHGIYHEN